MIDDLDLIENEILAADALKQKAAAIKAREAVDKADKAAAELAAAKQSALLPPEVTDKQLEVVKEKFDNGEITAQQLTEQVKQLDKTEIKNNAEDKIQASATFVPFSEIDLALIPLSPGTRECYKKGWTSAKPGDYLPTGHDGLNLKNCRTPDGKYKLFIPDFDLKNDPSGKALTRFLDKFPLFNSTYSVRTRSGGRHIYTLVPVDVCLAYNQDEWPEFDFLSNGLAPCAGTKVKEGEYVALDNSGVVILPDDYLNQFTKQAIAENKTADIEEPTLSLYDDFKTECQTAPVKGTFKLACNGRDCGLPQDVTYDLMLEHWNCQRPRPHTENELHKTVRNAYKYATSAFGNKTPEFRFPAPEAVPLSGSDANAADDQNKFDRLPSWIPQAWRNLSAPKKFDLRGSGLYFIEGGNKKPFLARIGGMFVVLAVMRGATEEDVDGFLLEFLTRHNEFRQLAIPANRLHKNPQELAQDLADLGYDIEPGMGIKLVAYINQCKPKQTFMAVSKTGWVDDKSNPEKLVFVFPTWATDPNYKYQPERYSSNMVTVRKSGTREDWNKKVFSLIKNNDLGIYEVIKAIAPSLLDFANAESQGENIVETTSRGKTTLMQIGASTIGHGGDPDQYPGRSYIKKWNQTGNAFEPHLAQHNHIPFYLDETGTYAGTVPFGTLVYNFFSGSGKEAMDALRNLKKTRSWRTILTSSGEKSISNRIKEGSYGKKGILYGGQAVRFTDRPLTISPFKDKAEVDAIKKACATSHGTLFPDFIEALIAKYKIKSALRKRVEQLYEKSMSRLCALYPDFSDVQVRALGRYAIAEVAGLLLVELGLIDELTETKVKNAVNTVIECWKDSAGLIGDEVRWIKEMDEHYLSHQASKFPFYDSSIRKLGAGVDAYRDRDGFTYESKHRVYWTPEAIQRVTGADPENVAKELDRRKVLVKDKGGTTLMKRLTIGGKQPWFYAVDIKDTEMDAAMADDDDASEKDAWQELLAGWIAAHKTFTNFEVLSALGYTVKDVNNKTTMRLKSVLDDMGYVYVRDHWFSSMWEALL